jgi:threonine synthase
MLNANRHGHVVCTQGGESIAGLKKAISEGRLEKKKNFVVDSTSHQLKFSGFQQMYFENSFPADYGVVIKDGYRNKPVELELDAFKVAEYLGLQKKD